MLKLYQTIVHGSDPCFVKAVKFTRENGQKLVERFFGEHGRLISIVVDRDPAIQYIELNVPNHKGGYEIELGDYLVKNKHGYHVCRGAIFEAVYEEVKIGGKNAVDARDPD